MKNILRSTAALALAAAAAFTSLPAAAADFTKEKSAVVYFTLLHNRIGGDRFEASRHGTGISEHVADIVAAQTNSPKLQLQQVSLYPNSYDETTDVALAEQKAGTRPELRSVPDVSDYDVVFLAFPCWWGSYPMAFATFFDTGALDGKTVIPLVTHGGSRLGRSMQDLRAALPHSRIIDGLAIRDRDAFDDDIPEDIAEFLEDIKL